MHRLPKAAKMRDSPPQCQGWCQPSLAQFTAWIQHQPVAKQVAGTAYLQVQHEVLGKVGPHDARLQKVHQIQVAGVLLADEGFNGSLVPMKVNPMPAC